MSGAQWRRKYKTTQHDAPMLLLLPIFNLDWSPHNPFGHPIPSIWLLSDITCAGIAMTASEFDRPVVAMTTVDASQITCKGLGLSLALLASGNHHHSLLAGIT